MGRSETCGCGTGFESRRWLSLDPCGIFGICLSWGVHLYAIAIIPFHLLSNSPLSAIVYYAAYVPSAILAMASLYMASSTDPGSVPLGARPLVTVRRAGSMCSTSSEQSGGGGGGGQTAAAENGNSNNNINSTQPLQPQQPRQQQQRAIRRCHKCLDNFKPPRAHHDSVTGRCIVKFDHFCPWGACFFFLNNISRSSVSLPD